MFILLECRMKFEKLHLFFEKESEAIEEMQMLSMLPHVQSVEIIDIQPCGPKKTTWVYKADPKEILVIGKNEKKTPKVAQLVADVRKLTEVDFLDINKGLWHPEKDKLSDPPKTTMAMIPVIHPIGELQQKFIAWRSSPRDCKLFAELYHEIVLCGGTVFGW